MPVTPNGGISASVGTLTTQAVQQTQRADMGGIDTRRVLASMMTDRARLTGPPPAFELNVLQHLRETQGKPDTQSGDIPPNGTTPADDRDIDEAPKSPDGDPRTDVVTPYDRVVARAAPQNEGLIDKLM